MSDSLDKPSSAWELEAEIDLWSSGGILALPQLEQEEEITSQRQQTLHVFHRRNKELTDSETTGMLTF